MQFIFLAKMIYFSWIFDVFDEDGGGTIEIDEVIKLVGSIVRINLS